MKYHMNSFQGLSIEQLRNLYRGMRALVLASEKNKFRDHKHFDEFASYYIHETKPILVARAYVLFAIGQVGHHYGTKHVIPPSQETLSWGGFLGGEINWTFEHAEMLVDKTIECVRTMH